jgi:hypothetical protein
VYTQYGTARLEEPLADYSSWWCIISCLTGCSGALAVRAVPTDARRAAGQCVLLQHGPTRSRRRGATARARPRAEVGCTVVRMMSCLLSAFHKTNISHSTLTWYVTFVKTCLRFADAERTCDRRVGGASRRPVGQGGGSDLALVANSRATTLVARMGRRRPTDPA